MNLDVVLVQLPSFTTRDDCRTCINTKNREMSSFLFSKSFFPNPTTQEQRKEQLQLVLPPNVKRFYSLHNNRLKNGDATTSFVNAFCTFSSLWGSLFLNMYVWGSERRGLMKRERGRFPSRDPWHLIENLAIWCSNSSRAFQFGKYWCSKQWGYLCKRSNVQISTSIFYPQILKLFFLDKI